MPKRPSLMTMAGESKYLPRGAEPHDGPVPVPNAEFIKFGDFSRDHLIWYESRRGYFVTLPSGQSFNGGPQLVSQRKLIEANAHE